MSSIQKILSFKGQLKPSKHNKMVDDEEDEIYPVGEDLVDSSDDEGELDDSKHAKLMEAITSMDTKKKSKVKQRSEPSVEVSEFQMNTKDAQGKGVWIHDLMGALRDTPSHSALKKQMNTINKRKLLPTPLHQHESDKIQRQMAYESASKEVSKWDHVVNTNKRAENMSFPLNQQVLGLPTTDQFVKKFKPSTPLEQEVYKILHGSKFAERPNKQLTKAEEEALKAMSLTEARERRAELQKHRALMSFYEAKCRRQKKIKSKKYHRIERKVKARQESKRIEKLLQTDPEAAQETIEKMEKSRATERMSLKHRNTGKWAKTMMKYGRHNISARQELAQQLQKSKELTEKIAEVNEDNKEDDDDDAGDFDDNEANIRPSLSDINNPWFTGGKSGSEKDKEEESKRGDKGGYIALEAIQAPKDDGDDDDEDDDEDDDGDEIDQDHKMLKMIQNERRKWEGVGKEQSEDDEDEEHDSGGGDEGGDDSSLVKRNKKQTKKSSQRKQSLQSKKSSKQDEKAKNGRTSLKKKNENEKKRMKKIIQVDDDDDLGDDDDVNDGGLEEGLERRQTHASLEDKEWLNQPSQETGALDVRQSIEVASVEQKTDGKTKKTTSSLSSSSIVDPSKVFTLKVKEVRSLDPELVEVDEADDDDGGNERMQQRMNIQQAFADDDVVEEFKEEKAAKVEKDKPKDIDLTLPGWGEWGGAGVKTSAKSKRKRKRFIIKAPPQAPRRDARLPHVIINENRDKKIALHQVNSLPFPFSNPDQFERSIRAPIGNTWNTPSAVKALTLPKVSTKMGAIITPIKAEETFKGKRKKKRQEEEQNNKRKGPRPDIELDDGDNEISGHKKQRRKGKGK